MDEMKPSNFEDEFQFSEAELEESTPYATSGTEEQASSDKKSGSRINRRTVLIAVGILVVAFSLYKLISVFFENSKTQKVVPAMATRAPVATPITSAVPSQTQKAVQIQARRLRLPSEVKQQLSQMQQHDVESKQQIQTIASDLSSLTVGLNSLQSSIASMNQQLNTMQQELLKQRSLIKGLEAKKRMRIAKKVRLKPRVAKPPARWFVRAVIPGRAWISQGEGNNITVRTGDRLPFYGRISYISATKGIVKTTSGAIFRFRGL